MILPWFCLVLCLGLFLSCAILSSTKELDVDLNKTCLMCVIQLIEFSSETKKLKKIEFTKSN